MLGGGFGHGYKEGNRDCKEEEDRDGGADAEV